MFRQRYRHIQEISCYIDKSIAFILLLVAAGSLNLELFKYQSSKGADFNCCHCFEIKDNMWAAFRV
jgi:hypothetical protein